MGRWFWLFDLFSPFRLQYAALFLVAFIGLMALRSWRAGAVVGALFLIHLVAIYPLAFGATEPVGQGPSLRIIQFNVLTSNQEIAQAAAWLGQQNADIIVAQETDLRWAAGLQSSLSGMTMLPTETIRSDNFGMAVFVRDGMETSGLRVVDANLLPSITFEASLDRGDSSVLVYAVHLLPPTNADAVEVGDEQTDSAVAVLAGHKGPKVLIGDLNATRWSSPYRHILSETNLRDAADGRGLTGTWPSRLVPLTGGITLDHVLVSPEFGVEGRTIGPHLGSDHRPVVVDLVLF